MANFKIGIAEVDFTPKLGLPLMGNFRDDYAARGVHDPLHCRAMVFTDGEGVKIAIVTVDVCMLGRSNVAFMREFISSKCDIAGENILIASTHTHSGPAPMQLGSLPEADEGDTKAFLTVACGAAVEANRDIGDSTLSVGYGSGEGLSFNRRLKCKDGETHMNWEGLDPDFVVEVLGPVDPEVVTVSVEQGGEPKAAMVNFALHPAILAGDNWLYSADYPGYLAEAMRKIFGDDFKTMFCNGCCGNVNHLDYSDLSQGRGYQMTERIGYALACVAEEAIKNQSSVRGDRLAISKKIVSLERIKITEEQRKWSEGTIENLKDTPTPGQVDGLPDEFYAKTYLAMYEVQGKDDEVEVMVIRVGDLGIVGLPGEVFCELGMEIKEKSPAKHTMVIELANDAIGYLPNEEAFALGGYEPSVGSTMYLAGSGEKVAASAVAQLNELFKQ